MFGTILFRFSNDWKKAGGRRSVVAVNPEHVEERR
jgi:hypothetical protein